MIFFEHPLAATLGSYDYRSVVNVLFDHLQYFVVYRFRPHIRWKGAEVYLFHAYSFQFKKQSVHSLYVRSNSICRTVPKGVGRDESRYVPVLCQTDFAIMDYRFDAPVPRFLTTDQRSFAIGAFKDTAPCYLNGHEKIKFRAKWWIIIKIDSICQSIEDGLFFRL